MKVRLITLLIILFTASSTVLSNTRGSGKAADVAVMDLHIEGTNINKLLAKIAYKYDVPMSLEVATNEGLLNSKTDSQA